MQAILLKTCTMRIQHSRLATWHCTQKIAYVVRAVTMHQSLALLAALLLAGAQVAPLVSARCLVTPNGKCSSTVGTFDNNPEVLDCAVDKCDKRCGSTGCEYVCSSLNNDDNKVPHDDKNTDDQPHGDIRCFAYNGDICHTRNATIPHAGVAVAATTAVVIFGCLLALVAVRVVFRSRVDSVLVMACSACCNRLDRRRCRSIWCWCCKRCAKQPAVDSDGGVSCCSLAGCRQNWSWVTALNVAIWLIMPVPLVLGPYADTRWQCRASSKSVFTHGTHGIWCDLGPSEYCAPSAECHCMDVLAESFNMHCGTVQTNSGMTAVAWLTFLTWLGLVAARAWLLWRSLSPSATASRDWCAVCRPRAKAVSSLAASTGAGETLLGGGGGEGAIDGNTSAARVPVAVATYHFPQHANPSTPVAGPAVPVAASTPQPRVAPAVASRPPNAAVAVAGDGVVMPRALPVVAHDGGAYAPAPAAIASPAAVSLSAQPHTSTGTGAVGAGSAMEAHVPAVVAAVPATPPMIVADDLNTTGAGAERQPAAAGAPAPAMATAAAPVLLATEAWPTNAQ